MEAIVLGKGKDFWEIGDLLSKFILAIFYNNYFHFVKTDEVVVICFGPRPFLYFGGVSGQDTDEQC